jgi:uncharacterized protein (DUF433 family)
MHCEIAIVDRGRGPQLSTSRITVLDLLPYFQLGYTHERIIREVMPSLSVAEIEAAERYIDDHREEVLEEDRRIRERNATRKNSPEVEEILRRAQQKLQARLAFYRNRRGEDSNGEGHSG